jgi:hypothetical protein
VAPTFDVARALGRLVDRTDAWRFIREFAASWVTPISDADGVADAELDAAEMRLGTRRVLRGVRRRSGAGGSSDADIRDAGEQGRRVLDAVPGPLLAVLDRHGVVGECRGG